MERGDAEQVAAPAVALAPRFLFRLVGALCCRVGTPVPEVLAAGLSIEVTDATVAVALTGRFFLFGALGFRAGKTPASSGGMLSKLCDSWKKKQEI